MDAIFWLIADFFAVSPEKRPVPLSKRVHTLLPSDKYDNILKKAVAVIVTVGFTQLRKNRMTFLSSKQLHLSEVTVTLRT